MTTQAKNTKNNRRMKILVSGGGTGGHIFPALSIANEIRRRHPQADILFVGACGRMEMDRVPAAGYPIVGLEVAGFDRRRPWRNFSVLYKLFKSMRKARRILADFRPDICIGVGGYASGPMLKAAQRKGIPTLIQEQNSYAGVTNKLLGAKAMAVCTAYEEAARFFPADKVILTGNPVRADLESCPLTPEHAREKLGFDPSRPLVLVVGGSLGARTINNAMMSAAGRITAAGASILWQTGKTYGAEAQNSPAAKLPGVSAVTFISDMAAAYRAADLVVARAGAGTISELQLLGCPSVLVPSPNVAENHQYKNAMALVNKNAAELVPDDKADTQLADTVCRLLADEKRRREMSRNISEMALRGAAARIVDRVEQIIAR